MERLKKEYEQIAIPNELDRVILTTLEKKEKQMRRKKNTRKVLVTAAAAGLILVGGINASADMAYALSDLPVIGSVVRVLNFRNFALKEGNFDARLQTPAIQGLGSALENRLNKQYLEENQKLYEEFIQETETLKSQGHKDAHMGIDAGYEIKTDNEQLLVIGRYVVNTAGSSSTVIQYDTIDKQNKLLLTLPSLFKDQSYIETISRSIKKQMKEQMKEEEKVYWLEDPEIGQENFTSIKPEQSFYINAQGKLVIAFDKYEVAPGYMGNPEFIIPTEEIQPMLVSNAYIR